MENTDPRPFPGVAVFAGDNFHPPVDGRYRNLVWEHNFRGFRPEIF